MADNRRLLDYETLGRFLGIAQMLADKTMAVEDAVKRIGEINAEYEARRKELTEVPK